MSSKHIFSSGTLALKLISIRVSDPGVVRRTGAGTRVQVMRVIREPADVRGGTGRGRRRRVAFPRGEIFDIVKTGWRFDPFNHLFYSNHPDVSTSKYVLEELFHRRHSIRVLCKPFSMHEHGERCPVSGIMSLKIRQ